MSNLDWVAVLRGRGLDSIVQARHAQADFGWAGVLHLSGAHSHELFPHAKRMRYRHCPQSLVADTLDLQALTPHACAQDGPRVESADIRGAGWDGLSTGVQRDQRPGGQLPDDDAHRLDRAAALGEPGGYLNEILPGQVDNRVEQVSASVEEKTAAGEFGLLPPGAVGELPPILPDGGANALQDTQLPGTDQLHGGANLRGEATLEGDHPGRRPPAADRCDHEFRSGCVLRQRSSPSVSRGGRLAQLPGRLWPGRGGGHAG